MRGIWLSIGALALIPLGTVQPAFGCTCAQQSVAEIVCDSQIVFEGDADQTTPAGLDRQFITKFRVTTNWKGADKAEIAVIHSDLPSMCGVTFDDNRSYLVFAYSEQNHLTAGLCSLTKADPVAVRPALQAVRNRTFASREACIAAADAALKGR